MQYKIIMTNKCNNIILLWRLAILLVATTVMLKSISVHTEDWSEHSKQISIFQLLFQPLTVTE